VTATDLLAGLAILAGLAGIVVPVLPGALLILVAVLVWAAFVGTGTAWAVAGVAVLLLVAGTVVKYTIPGSRLKAAGVPTSSIVLGGFLGIVGFFVVPVAGLFVGFIAGSTSPRSAGSAGRTPGPAPGLQSRQPDCRSSSSWPRGSWLRRRSSSEWP